MNKIPEKTLQTAENTWYLFPSTDTTAIYSFIIAAIVGLALALIGMYLAWWYGKKSFDLTTKSFEITVQQIISSIESAESNTTQIVRSNSDSLIKQEELKRKELIFQSRQVWLNDLRDTTVLYLESLSRIGVIYKKNIIFRKGDEKNNLMYIDDFADEIVKLNRFAYKIELLFKPDGENEDTILNAIKAVRTTLNNELPKYKSSIDDDEYKKIMEPCIDKFKIEMRKLLKKEWEKTKLLK